MDFTHWLRDYLKLVLHLGNRAFQAVELSQKSTPSDFAEIRIGTFFDELIEITGPILWYLSAQLIR